MEPRTCNTSNSSAECKLEIDQNFFLAKLAGEVKTYLADAKAQGDEVCDDHFDDGWRFMSVVRVCRVVEECRDLGERSTYLLL
jgi:hypothetical protein